jgi:hypothetical protein
LNIKHEHKHCSQAESSTTTTTSSSTTSTSTTNTQMPSSSHKKNKRKRESSDGSEDTPSEVVPTVIKEQGLELVSGLTFLNDSATSSSDENLQYWLIKAPTNFDPKLLDGTTLKMATNSSSIITNDNDSEYVMTNRGTGDSVQQIVGFAPTDSDGEMVCLPPFTREIHVVESFSQDTARKNTTLRGVKHQAYKAPAQIKLGYRLKCAGATSSGGAGSSESSSGSSSGSSSSGGGIGGSGGDDIVAAPAKKLKKSKKNKKKSK